MVLHEPRIDVASPRRQFEICNTGRNDPDPDPAEITAQLTVANRIQVADESERLDDLIRVLFVDDRQAVDCRLVVSVELEPIEKALKERLLFSLCDPAQTSPGTQFRSSGNTGIGMNDTPSSARLRASSGVASP